MSPYQDNPTDKPAPTPTRPSPTSRSGRRSGLLAIIRKEFRRFFTDRRLVLTTVLLPGLMIFVVYSLVGEAMTTLLSVDEDYAPTVYAVDLPASVATLATEAGIAITPLDANEADAIKASITNKEADLLAIFPQDFDQAIAAASIGDPGYSPPQVALYYNSSRNESGQTFMTVSGLLESYRNASFTLFSVNTPGATYDLVTEQDEAGFLLASLLPFLMMILLFTGSMSIAPESIAGEKERGTIATLLVTPLKRWELALGKMVSISCIALLSGTSSFLGFMLSLPRMVGGAAEGMGALYGVTDYLLLFAVIVSTVMLFVGLISLISAYARTIKEATTSVSPLMILAMLAGVMAIFSSEAQASPLFYLIPAYNSVQSMVGIFSFTGNPLLVLETVVVNLAIAAVCVVVLTKMFNNEKIVFAR